MTLTELRRQLNALPLEAERWSVGALDVDQADPFDIEDVAVVAEERKVWIRMRYAG